jgi:hypothetical protein
LLFIFVPCILEIRMSNVPSCSTTCWRHISISQHGAPARHLLIARNINTASAD